jgi:hypothetical protein
MTREKQNTFLFAHQANIDRYRQILVTQLTAEERRLIEMRLAEQQAALKQLASIKGEENPIGYFDQVARQLPLAPVGSAATARADRAAMPPF